MGSRRDQELAATLTAAASAPPAAPAAALGTQLGRYRLERELGSGGMGVVHAAFDPDLERRIAVKVLRSATAEARDRLLREARAMARLAHPNVVTVYEVGSAEGRDFVAMELIHGASLADWLRDQPRGPSAIIEAFVAAGRGLAAAHAAGIVHRDFKPHNVLRSRDGRIVVTDFGLARDLAGVAAADDPPAALETTLPAQPRAELTMTGALLGTPAYMAPEQWRGGQVSPATDQFAYCVALWEALAGARPFPGPTFDDLRVQVARGPAALDSARIPRRLRAILRRGLAVDASRRWPSMDALLAQIARAQRRPLVMLALATGALVTAAAIVLAVRSGPAEVACEPPARDAAAVWSPADRVATQAQASPARAAVLDAAAWAWQAARGSACAAPAPVRAAQLACLDGVANRFDVVRQAFARVPTVSAEEVQATLVDPAICLRPTVAEVPRLTLAPTPAVVGAYALYARSQGEHKPDDRELRAVDPVGGDPCARAIAAAALDDASHDPARRRVLRGALASAEQCGDERLRADLLLRAAAGVLSQLSTSEQATTAVREAELAVHRVGQPDLAAAVAGLQRLLAGRRHDWDARFRFVDDEIAGYRARGLVRRELAAVVQRNEMRTFRLDAGDLEAVGAEIRRWRPVAVAQGWTDLVRELDVEDANLRFDAGDVAQAHADLVRLWHASPAAEVAGPTLEGEVMDERGAPVAGATVATAASLFSDSVGVGLPFYADDLALATTDRTGHFTLHGVALGGPIVAQLGDGRSHPVASADHVRLRLEPTRTVRGTVDLGGVPASQVRVFVSPLDSELITATIAPVAADGNFTLAGISRRPVLVTVRLEGRDTHGMAGDYRKLPASAAAIDNLALAIKPANRALDVIMRSAVSVPLTASSGWVLSGHWDIRNLRDLLRAPVWLRTEIHPDQIGDRVPTALAGQVRNDDLFEHLDHTPDGDITVCAVSVPTAPTFERHMKSHPSAVVVTCKHLVQGDAQVVLDLPPQQRFD